MYVPEKKICVLLACENDVKLQSYAPYKNKNCSGLIYYLTSCLSSALNEEMVCQCFFKAVLFFFQKCFHKTSPSWSYAWSCLGFVFFSLGTCWLLGEILVHWTAVKIICVSEMHCSCGMQKTYAEQHLNGELFLVKDMGKGRTESGLYLKGPGNFSTGCKYCDIYSFSLWVGIRKYHGKWKHQFPAMWKLLSFLHLLT